MSLSPQSSMRSGYEFTNKRSVGHGDAGWGVAQREPKLERYEWVWSTDKDGIRSRRLVVQVRQVQRGQP
jgi:hypothetical protein